MRAIPLFPPPFAQYSGTPPDLPCVPARLVPAGNADLSSLSGPKPDIGCGCDKREGGLLEVFAETVSHSEPDPLFAIEDEKAFVEQA